MAQRKRPGSGERPRSRNSRGVRIIAGEWRGRRIPVTPVNALRPTPDRVRETLFNWLMPTLRGSHCLDLFAGSGALGWEALSRGAASVSFVEQDRAIAQALLTQQASFASDAANIVCCDAEAFLNGTPQLFDLVFLDPPYSVPLQPWLARLWPAWLAPTGRIYIERDSAQALEAAGSLGHLSRRGRAGGVHYGLLERRVEP